MNIDSLVARWRQFEKTLAERDLSWGLHYAPAHLRWARRAGHPRGAELGHLLPDDYRAFVAAVGYPVVGFSYYDAQGLSMLPPEPMAVISVELPGPDDDWPEPDPVAPTRCRYAFFAGSELSDIEGFAFGAAEDGGPPLVWLVEGGMAREPIAPFADWLTGELARLEERIAHVDAQTATAWREENAGETDPHRLLDYALDGSYELPPFAVADLELAWVGEPVLLWADRRRRPVADPDGQALQVGPPLSGWGRRGHPRGTWFDLRRPVDSNPPGRQPGDGGRRRRPAAWERLRREVLWGWKRRRNNPPSWCVAGVADRGARV